MLDLAELEHRLATLEGPRLKGTTGTQASFLELFGGDHAEGPPAGRARSAAKIGFDGVLPGHRPDLSAQDRRPGRSPSCRASPSAHKLATDLRLLQHRKEIEEPFEKEQVGSSAMAYKRNPMRCERMCSLARFVMSLEPTAASDRRRRSGSSARWTTAPTAASSCRRRSWPPTRS